MPTRAEDPKKQKVVVQNMALRPSYERVEKSE